MKKTIIILIVLSFIKGYSAYGQKVVLPAYDKSYHKIPQESIFVHINSSLLLSGEYLYYKVYCLDNKSKNLSNISKVAYVELVSSDKTQVFKHKIKLGSGMGQGDYFIPTTITSGNYKLIAYTQWMRNGEENLLFQSDISIINPFQASQDVLSKDGGSTGIEKYGLEPIKRDQGENQAVLKKGKNLEFHLNSRFYSKREKVSLKITNVYGGLSSGNYSISIRKKDAINIPDKPWATGYMTSNAPDNTLESVVEGEGIFIPELRGELISGTVYTDSDTPVSNIKVGISLSGKNYIFKVANTNESGIFYFNIDRENESKNAVIQVIDQGKENIKIEVHKQTPLSYDYLKFNEFSIAPELENIILEHSIYNQVENSFNTVKPDSIYKLESIIPFFQSRAQIILLDDYTRFPTLKETAIEVIDPIYLKQKRGKYTFHVKLYEEDIESGLLPLVMVDGLFIQDHNELADFNARKIKKVSIVSEQYVYGSQIFEGIISFETFEGNYSNTISGNYIKKVDIDKPEIDKKYFNQVYSGGAELDRIPDYRTQLLWNPKLKLAEDEETVVFYTSDVSGEFEICLEGFNDRGEPVSLREVINVN